MKPEAVAALQYVELVKDEGILQGKYRILMLQAMKDWKWGDQWNVKYHARNVVTSARRLQRYEQRVMHWVTELEKMGVTNGD